MASTAYPNIALAICSLNLPNLWRWKNSSPPGQKSRIK